jgi:hypothetical protein
MTFWTLFLDDIRFPESVKLVGPKSKVIICRSFDDAVWSINNYGMPDFISFDHDLGEGKTGYDFAKWLGDYIMDNNMKIDSWFTYQVHSANPVGAKNIDEYMKNLIKNFGE